MGNDRNGLERDRQDEYGISSEKRSRFKIALWTLLVIVLLIGGTVGGALWYINRGLQPMPALDTEVELTIAKGTNSGQIASMLEEKGLIRNETIFKYYLMYKNEGSRFQAGVYRMKPGMTLDEMIAKLNAGDTVKEEMIRFTVPEGLTVSQLADKLSGDNIVNRDTFLGLVDSGEGLNSSRIADIPADAKLKHKLEGYLFPETYELKKGSTEKDMINRMLEELERQLAMLPADWEQKLKERGISFHEMMTIASLIEREVVVDEERPLVASVIYNRLAKKQKLQIDATVQYLFDKQKERLLNKDLKIESPYNTYLHEGLPPGPIANPGLASIEAAIYPAQSNYYFYVTKKDGSQAHLFAETYAQHKKNIEESKKTANN